MYHYFHWQNIEVSIWLDADENDHDDVIKPGRLDQDQSQLFINLLATLLFS